VFFYDLKKNSMDGFSVGNASMRTSLSSDNSKLLGQSQSEVKIFDTTCAHSATMPDLKIKLPSPATAKCFIGKYSPQYVYISNLGVLNLQTNAVFWEMKSKAEETVIVGDKLFLNTSASPSTPRSCIVWDLHTKKKVGPYAWEKFEFVRVQNGVVIFIQDQTTVVYDAETNKEIYSVNTPTNEYLWRTQHILTNDKSKLITISFNKGVVIDLKTRSEIASWNSPGIDENKLVYVGLAELYEGDEAPHKIATCHTNPHRIEVRALNTCELERAIEFPSRIACFSLDNKGLLYVSVDNAFHIYDTKKNYVQINTYFFMNPVKAVGAHYYGPGCHKVALGFGNSGLVEFCHW